jgi:hypothetical protein
MITPMRNSEYKNMEWQQGKKLLFCDMELLQELNIINTAHATRVR